MSLPWWFRFKLWDRLAGLLAYRRVGDDSVSPVECGMAGGGYGETTTVMLLLPGTEMVRLYVPEVEAASFQTT